MRINIKSIKAVVPNVIIAVLLSGVLVAANSCKKFLSAYSQSQSFVTTANDLDEILVGDAYSNWIGDTKSLFVMDDDVEESPPVTLPNGNPDVSYSEGFYNWQPNPYIASDGTLGYYQNTVFAILYMKISRINTIIFNVPLMQEKGEPDSILRRVDGEARFLRAYYYFMLVNVYGKPYNIATAGTDYGIPLKLNPDIEDKFFTRATVEEVYKQIINDLLQAENELKEFNENSVVRANQAAAQALLSRVYLYLEDWENAAAYADKVIRKNYQVSDLNAFDNVTHFLKLSSPEIIFNVGVNAQYSWYDLFSATYTTDTYKVSDELMNKFETKDLRRDIFLKRTDAGVYVYAKVDANPPYDVSDLFLIRLPEIYLNKAEALAVLGRDAEATTVLQELRKKRFKPEDLSVISLTGAALVNFIRDERRRELCFEAHRWFDLRRYAVNSKFPFSKTIRHNSYAYNSGERYMQGYYELRPYAQDQAAYVLPIHQEEIEFNQGSLINERRPVRELHQ
ncbi:RagB/SusD family nutrient uptake outer membrane protein [Niabella beijingensis]|uniref:RagB/SusD family nutrient uptake outer membrane protein n=1 Tax=Niabella beijingensis TaxID=2872700 RepID=UPI001CBED126|nr:RagB/SusD family nutrient uptake outer membrane protein [Niabella beijingensis]MBZ4189378.1 RagB/SusD family nutrient uptake outer membrane protein [Niabella beijingensis]